MKYEWCEILRWTLMCDCGVASRLTTCGEFIRNKAAPDAEKSTARRSVGQKVSPVLTEWRKDVRF